MDARPNRAIRSAADDVCFIQRVDPASQLRTELAQLVAFEQRDSFFDVLPERRLDGYLELRVCYAGIEEQVPAFLLVPDGGARARIAAYGSAVQGRSTERYVVSRKGLANVLRRPGRELRVVWTPCAAIALLALLVPRLALASPRVTPQDRAATRAYLEAKYAYEQALVGTAAASDAAAERVANRLAGECPGVLVGAPHETLSKLLEPSPHSQTARQTGEANRQQRQLSDLQGELALALGQEQIAPDRQAALAYARAVRSLRWSNNAVTLLVRASAVESELELQTVPPQVCADMKAWIASGYKTLSPATKTLIAHREATLRTLLRLVRRARVGLLSLDPMVSYEGPREKALARRIDALERDLASARKGLGAVESALERTLGLISQAESEMHEARPKGSVEIGHGRTAAGGSYQVWFEPKQPRSAGQGTDCQLSVGVDETNESGTSSGAIEISSGGSAGMCLSRSHPKAPSVQCERGQGLLTIEAQTLPGARTVRLQLSNGRQITSRVSLVPAKLGGPAGFYYQVVRGPSPIPVSLTEADGHGRPLRTLQLPHIAKCTKESPKPIPGIRTIASGSLPQGPSFSIFGERFSYLGETQFDLGIEVNAEGEASPISNSSGSIAVGGGRRPKPSPFGVQIKTGCQPHEYAIIYGVLKAPSDTVLARSSAGLEPLRRARIPASFHVRGVLAYIELPAAPSELLVRTPAGKTIVTEKLGVSAREARETCEGEAEGPG